MTTSTALYLAFGPYRVRAALAHTAALAEAGTDVHLLVSDRPEWREAEAQVDPRVRVRRIGAGESGVIPGQVVFWRRARAAVESLLAEADPQLLIAGDAHAIPAAYHAARLRPQLTVVHEPEEPGMAAPAGSAAEGEDAIGHLAVVAPWYPSPNNPFAGAFVRASTQAVAPYARGISVLHTEDWTGPAGGLAADLVRTAAERLPVTPRQVSGLLRVPVLVFPKRSYAEMAEAHVRALERTLPGGRIDADVVHGHVGIYGGLVATRLAAKSARVVVTEHATFLHRILRSVHARELYAEVLERADDFLCVGEELRTQLVGYFPQFAEKIRIVPNAVDFEAIPAGAQPRPTLDRWLYVGRLIEQKNVATLLEAFALAAAENPEARLTLVGSGEQHEQLRARAEDLGLAERVELTGPLPPEQVVARMHEADLLVHASRYETFGMTIVEAVAAGLPVLVSRSGGPEETLAGLDGVAGRLVEVSDDPSVLLNGYRALREGFAELDLPAARKVLASRYGSPAVGARLAAAYGLRTEEDGAMDTPEQPQDRADEGASAPDTASDQTSAPAPLDHVVVGEGDAPARVLLLALNHPTPRRVIAYAHWLIARGVEVTLVSVQGSHWRGLGLDPRVEIRTLREAEGKHPLPRGERVIVNRAPRALLRRARAQVEARNRTRSLELAVGVAERAHLRASEAFHRKVFLRGYRVLRPYLLAQVSGSALSGIDFSAIDLVVAADSNAITLGWQLARRHPDLPATTAMDRERFAGRTVTDPAVDPEQQQLSEAGADDSALVAVGTAAPGLEG